MITAYEYHQHLEQQEAAGSAPLRIPRTVVLRERDIAEERSKYLRKTWSEERLTSAL